MSSEMKVFLAKDHGSSGGGGMFTLFALLLLGAGGWWFFAHTSTQTPSSIAADTQPEEMPVRVIHNPQAELPPEPAAKAAPAPPPAPFVNAAFTKGTDGFEYVDDAFRATTQPEYAAGARISDGFNGGGLSVRLGGRDSKKIAGMSGGWRTTFELPAPTRIWLQFHYNMTQSSEYEADEFSQVLCTVGGLQPGTQGDVIAQFKGDGNGGQPPTTGWKTFQANLGQFPAGKHALTIGVYNSAKSAENEWTELKIDDVRVETGDNHAPPEQAPVPLTQKPAAPSAKQDLTF